MKSCTDIPQSEKLAEILPIKSADMMYKQILPKSGRISHVPEIGNPLKSLEWYNKGYTYAGQKALSIEEYCIPCWSLAALLELIPKNYLIEANKKTTRTLYHITAILGEVTHYHQDLVDAAVEMLLKLYNKNNNVK